MQTVLEVEGVSHRYGAQLALDDVDLEVCAGECVALLGPNGAGKTSLVNLVVGLRPRQQGTIRVAGGDPLRAETRRNLGVVQQAAGLPPTLSVRELVAGAAVRAGLRRQAAEPIMAEVGLLDLAGRRSGKLSGGQRQRVQLAMALVAEPRLLVMDEPTVGLDVPHRRRFWELIASRRAQGAGVVVTTHMVEESAAVADRVVVIHEGRVLASERPDNLIALLPDRTVIARTTIDGAELEALPGVTSTGRDDDGRVRLGTRSPEALLRVLLNRDPDLSDLRVEAAGLEEAVVSLIEAGGTPPSATTTTTQEVPG